VQLANLREILAETNRVRRILSLHRYGGTAEPCRACCSARSDSVTATVEIKSVWLFDLKLRRVALRSDMVLMERRPLAVELSPAQLASRPSRIPRTSLQGHQLQVYLLTPVILHGMIATIGRLTVSFLIGRPAPVTPSSSR
jgi:hypothetical protein